MGQRASGGLGSGITGVQTQAQDKACWIGANLLLLSAFSDCKGLS